MSIKSLVGEGRAAIGMIADGGSFVENEIGNAAVDADLGPGAVVGTGQIGGRTATIIANDAKVANPRFPVASAGVIGVAGLCKCNGNLSCSNSKKNKNSTLTAENASTLRA